MQIGKCLTHQLVQSNKNTVAPKIKGIRSQISELSRMAGQEEGRKLEKLQVVKKQGFPINVIELRICCEANLLILLH